MDVFGGATDVAVPTSFDELVTAMTNALAGAAGTEPYLAGAKAYNVRGTVRVLAPTPIRTCRTDQRQHRHQRRPDGRRGPERHPVRTRDGITAEAQVAGDRR